MKLPLQVLELLNSEKFCFLATSFQDRPHLSLMNFTYLPAERMVVLSSRTDTTKVKHIEQNPAVALLLYNLGTHKGVPVSCTLYGTATLVAPEDEGAYRRKHYEKNKDMEIFIKGPRIRIIAVRITHTALVDMEDKVRTWTEDQV